MSHSPERESVTSILDAEHTPVSQLGRVVFAVDAETPLDEFAEGVLLPTGEHALPVIDGETIIGVACLSDVLRVIPAQRAALHVRDIMTPWEHVRVVDGEATVADAVKILDDASVQQLPIVDAGCVIGMVHRSDVLDWLDLHAQP